MSDKPKLTDEDKEDLVAYLDGELDDATSQVLEEKLSTDSAARAEAESLRQVWDMLDYLPRAEPSASFTHRTLDRVSAVRPSTSARAVELAGRSWRGVLAWAAATAAALFIGYYGVRLSAPQPPPRANADEEERKQLVRDLRVIENYHLYQAAEDAEFLRALDHPDLFGDESATR